MLSAASGLELMAACLGRVCSPGCLLPHRAPPLPVSHDWSSRPAHHSGYKAVLTRIVQEKVSGDRAGCDFRDGCSHLSLPHVLKIVLAVQPSSGEAQLLSL